MKESEKIEFKSEFDKEAFKKTLIGFCNTKGGNLYIGIEDDGSICGIDNVHEILESISNCVRDSIRPDIRIFVDAKRVVMQGQNVINVEVSEGVKKPYYLDKKGMKPSGVYIRHGITTSHASEELIKKMLIESDGAVFENNRCFNQVLTFDNLIKEFKNKGIDLKPNNMKTLRMIDEDNFYTQLAFLLSEQSDYETKFAVFNGIDKSEFKSRKEFTGSIIKQLNDIYINISAFNGLNSKIIGLNRIDLTDYLEEAIREALINAIVH